MLPASEDMLATERHTAGIGVGVMGACGPCAPGPQVPSNAIQEKATW